MAAGLANDPFAVLSGLKLRDSELKLELTEFKIHTFHLVPTYFFSMLVLPDRTEAGSINLRVASTPHVELYAGHIGYGVHPQHRGHHFAARSVVLLKPLARRLGLDPIWITCDPENRASRRSLELSGAQFVEIVDVPMNCGIRIYGGKSRKCRFRL